MLSISRFTGRVELLDMLFVVLRVTRGFSIGAQWRFSLTRVGILVHMNDQTCQCLNLSFYALGPILCINI
jgi:hypothetical protein